MLTCFVLGAIFGAWASYKFSTKPLRKLCSFWKEQAIRLGYRHPMEMRNEGPAASFDSF